MTEMILTWKTSSINLAVHSPWLLRDFGVVSNDSCSAQGLFTGKLHLKAICKAMFFAMEASTDLSYGVHLSWPMDSFDLHQTCPMEIEMLKELELGQPFESAPPWRNSPLPSCS